MTKCLLEKVADRYYIEIYGHSNYAENQKDIVCAGVSTLALSFGILCEKYEEKKLCKIAEEQINDGLFLLIVEGQENELDSAFEMLLTGIEQIAKNYPQNVSVRGGILNI